MSLVVEELTIRIAGRTVLDRLSFELGAGERLGLIGESGSGKSMTALALLGLLPPGAQTTGSIRLGERELLGLPDARMATVRGREIGIVFQEPATALNPVRKIGSQIGEALQIHYGYSRAEALSHAVQLAEQVGLPEPSAIVSRYPHELSGGQRQRVAIAIALSAQPAVLLADEPTTALDVTTQARILDLFDAQLRQTGASLLFITHDLAVLSQIARKAIVLSDGREVESGALADLVHRPRHPVTRGLAEAARATSFEHGEES